MKILSVFEAQELSPEEHVLIDVRSPGEFRSEHILHSENVPLDSIEAADFNEIPAKRIVLICQSGVRSRKAGEHLPNSIESEVYSVEGGLNAWKAAGYPTAKGQGSISIERQVRIGAGALVALFSVLGLTLHTGFFAVPIFIGCGLVFAGITDICGMGLLLVRAPWNR
ncbi:MAG: rhodanese-like domain-containing protein [Verrucomicrobiota bacterium]